MASTPPRSDVPMDTHDSPITDEMKKDFMRDIIRHAKEYRESKKKSDHVDSDTDDVSPRSDVPSTKLKNTAPPKKPSSAATCKDKQLYESLSDDDDDFNHWDPDRYVPSYSAGQFHLRHWEAIQALTGINGHRPAPEKNLTIRSYILCGVNLKPGVKDRFFAVAATHLPGINRELADVLHYHAGIDPVPEDVRDGIFEVDPASKAPFSRKCSTFFPFAGVAGMLQRNTFR